jgi:hypothetical protein
MMADKPTDDELKKALERDVLDEVESVLSIPGIKDVIHEVQVAKAMKEQGDDHDVFEGDDLGLRNLTAELALPAFAEHNETKKKMLEARDDTTHSTELSRYLRIVKELGFQLALEIPFSHKREDEPTVHEKLYMMWRKGILLVFDTYWNQETVNGGSFYYNWKPYDINQGWKVMSSGHMTEGGVIVGNHDCREALRYNISQLEKHGEFLPKWVEQDHLWLLHWADLKEYSNDDYTWLHNGTTDEIRAKRIAMLPQHVRDAITPGR